MFESLLTAEGLIGLVTLVLMEIVLGIDNIIFIAILCGFLPKKEDQKRARTIGLTLALAIRVVWLFTISLTCALDSFDARAATRMRLVEEYIDRLLNIFNTM